MGGMQMCKCKFYEVDLVAKKEGDAMEAAYFGSMNETEREAMDAWAAMEATDEPDPFAKCGEYCKHQKSDRGFPGERVYQCIAPGNEHIIHVDFIESEII